jgi:hypothetical protein
VTENPSTTLTTSADNNVLPVAGAAGAAGAGGAAIAAGIFGRRNVPATVSKSPADTKGQAVTRFPFQVSQPPENRNYSENLDRCVKSLSANKTGTSPDNWYLVSDQFNSSTNKHDVAYDAKYPTKDDERIKKDMTEYISTGGMSRDIQSKCNEPGVSIDALSPPAARSATKGHRRGLRGGRLAGLIVGVVLGALLLCCLLPLLCLCWRRRRRRETDSEDDDQTYSRERFSTARPEHDVESGHTSPRTTDVDGHHDGRSGHHARNAGLAGAGAVTAATAANAAASSPAAESIAASSFTSRNETDSSIRAGSPLPHRDVAGNFTMDSARDQEGRSIHPHDYEIGAGPVTTATPLPPQDYVAKGPEGVHVPSSDGDQRHAAGRPASTPGTLNPSGIRDSTSDQYRHMMDGIHEHQ